MIPIVKENLNKCEAVLVDLLNTVWGYSVAVDECRCTIEDSHLIYSIQSALEEIGINHGLLEHPNVWAPEDNEIPF